MKQSEVKRLLEQYHLMINKKWGQNFLIDENLIKKITDAVLTTNPPAILEIGPGLGSLTRAVVESNIPILAYEIDKGFATLLSEDISASNLHIIQADFLRADLKADLQKYEIAGIPCIMANLPYYITSAVILKLLEELPVQNMILMMQKEVANRLLGQVSTKEYNALSVLVQYHMDVTALFDVQPSAFYPSPTVTSTVLLMKKRSNKEHVLNEPFFNAFNRAIFAQRRKTLVNNLLHSQILAPSFNRATIIQLLSSAHISENARAEELDIVTIVDLSNRFFEKQAQLSQ